MAVFIKGASGLLHQWQWCCSLSHEKSDVVVQVQQKDSILKSRVCADADRDGAVKF